MVTTRFEFAAPGRILFGPGKLGELPPLAAGWGRRALVVTGRHPERADRLAGALHGAGIESRTLPTDGEPTLASVAEAAAFAAEGRFDMVIGFGGGSAIDTAKAVAALAPDGGDLLDHLEVAGRGLPLEKPPLPVIAVPTTAGSGAEATRNAVIVAGPAGTKVSLRDIRLIPRLAVVDPELALGLPPDITASTGMDALTQLLEAFVSPRATAMTDPLCREGIRRASRALPAAFRDGADIGARSDMALAALFGGIALANAGLGAVHGFAAPIGGMFRAPHGAVCAALLPHVMEANLRALRESPSGEAGLRRFEQAARLLTGDGAARGEDGVRRVADLARELGIPGLGRFGITAADVGEIARKAAAASSMKGNPAVFRETELAEILLRAVGADGADGESGPGGKREKTGLEARRAER
jgi:alcohol dehydrogenase class IV